MTGATESLMSIADGPMTVQQLGELLTTFDDVTAKLRRDHDTLRAEVIRLSSELSDANAALERSRRLAALGEMAAGIAHEVRNPLGCIGLYAEMLEADLGDQPALRRIASNICEAVRGANAVVNDVLTFAQEMHARPTWVEASSLFRGAVADAIGPGGDTGESVAIETTDRACLELCCDPALTRCALSNLIRNAVQALEEHGAEAPRIELDASASSAGMTLSVSDNGPGVSPEVIDRIFNPFYTTRAAGSGLGLAIVHRIMDAHGGSIRVRETPGGGARFQLQFPATDAGQEER